MEDPSLTSLLLGPSSPGHCLVVAVLVLDLTVVQVLDPLVAADQAQPALVTAYQLRFLSLTSLLFRLPLTGRTDEDCGIRIPS